MRKPSIHISEDLLAKLISVILRDDPKILPKDLAKRLLIEARKHSLSNRVLLATTQKQRKTIEKVKQSPLENAMIVAKSIYYTRRSLKHRGISIATVGSKEFSSIKVIASNILEFQELFMEKNSFQAVTDVYVLQAFSIMGKSINVLRIPSLHNKIMDGYEAQQKLQDNGNIEYTDRAYKRYNKKILDSVGTILVDYQKFPDKYQKFMEVAEICKSLKITPEIYIDAQFEGLKWANAIPEPNQLVGEKASERLQKYLFENQVQLKDHNKEVNKDKVNKLKDILKKK